MGVHDVRIAHDLSESIVFPTFLHQLLPEDTCFDVNNYSIRHEANLKIKEFIDDINFIYLNCFENVYFFLNQFYWY